MDSVESTAKYLRYGSAERCAHIPRLLDITESILHLDGLNVVFDKIFDAIGDLFAISEMFIAISDKKRGLYVVRALRGFPEAYSKKIMGFGFSPEKVILESKDCFRVGRNSYYIRFEDWSYYHPEDPFYDKPEKLTQPRVEENEWHEAEYFVFHMMDKSGEPIGFLEIDDSIDGKLPAIEAVKGVEAFSELAAIAIQNMERYENELSEREFTMMLIDLIGHDIHDFANEIVKDCDRLLETRAMKRDALAAIELVRRRTENINSVVAQIGRIADAKKRRSELDLCIDLVPTVQRSMLEILKLYPAKRLKFTFDPPSENVLARADDQIEEVFINLFSNAIKCAENENITIEVLIEPDKREDREYWRLSISDNGIGISDQKKRNLFDLYIEKGKDEDQGLGLFMSRILMMGYGGDIEIDDRVKGFPDKGACYRLLIPKFNRI